MRYETPLNQEALIRTIAEQYHLEVIDLFFYPHGEVGQHYILSCPEDRRYFLTFLGDNRLARLQTVRLEAYLALTDELYERGLLRNLAHPIRTQAGSLNASFMGQPLILYDYISGTNLEEMEAIPPAITAKMAKMVANLHDSTPWIKTAIPFVETFSIHSESALREGLAALEQVSAPPGSGKRILKYLLLPRRKTILRLLDRFHELAAQVSQLDLDFVLCHTDAHRGNMILDERGELYLVDWEGVTLAPAEYDLFIFTGDDFPVFLRAYRQQRPQVRLHGDLFGFYFYRRNLDDLTDWVVRILYENTTAEQDHSDLQGIREFCIAGWPGLEKGIDTVKRHLSETA